MDQQITSIKYPFAIDRGLGMLQEEKDFSNHVRQMMMQVLFTNPGERINRPDFGCGIRRMVFAPNSDTAASMLQVLVHQSLDKWLGDLIIVGEVTALAVDSTMEVTIGYSLKATQENQFLTFTL